MRRRAWSAAIDGLGRVVDWALAYRRSEFGPTLVKEPTVSVRGAVRADVVPALCRGVTGGCGGVDAVRCCTASRDDLVWSPSSYWRERAADELLIEGEVRASVVRAYFVTGLVLDVVGGAAWFVVPRRSVH